MKCFVISPIGAENTPERKHADDVFKILIKPALKACQLESVRSDQIAEPGRVSERMFHEILNDQLCIAVLTGHNPNVFYELAVAQAAARPVVILIRRGESIPFDIKDFRCIEYDLEATNVAKYKKAIVQQVNDLKARNWTVQSIIQSHLDKSIAQKQAISGHTNKASKYDVFISSPMKSVSQQGYEEIRLLTIDAIKALRQNGRFNTVYYSGMEYTKQDEFDPADVGTDRDFRALRESRSFLLIYPEKLVTSSLVEAGYALALGLPSFYFVRDVNDLPYMLQRASEPNKEVKLFVYDNPSKLVQQISKYV